MARKFATYLVVLLAASTSTHAVAQNPRDMINMFSAIMRAAVIDHARQDWSKVPLNEASCVEERLRQRGYSVDTLVQNGIVPTDPRIADIRSGCRVSMTSLPSPRDRFDNIESISARPTFDCNKARTATARIVCLDQAGADADWDLISAYWARTFSLAEPARKGFSQAQENWLQSLNRTCRLQAEQSTFNPAQKQCVLTAYRRRAELYRSRLSGDALSESRLTPEQHVQIQSELIKLGYLSGEADGEFGPLTRAAIKSFQAQSGIPQNEFLNGQQRQQLVQAGQPPDTAGSGPRRDNEKDHPQVPPPPPQPPKDALRLKQARVFLEDAQKFIAAQKTVPKISEIANEAANLKIALTKFDEAGAVQSMAHLSDLLKQVHGFDEFENQQKADRQRENARQLAEASSEGDKNTYFIDKYLKENLGDSRTSSLIKLRDQISAAQTNSAIEELTNANDVLQAYVTDNGLSNAYRRIVKEYTSPTIAKGPTTLEERLGITDKSKFVVEGPADEIALLYNASPNAPNVWINVRGDVVFQSDTASLCFVQADPEVTMFRYTVRILGEQGAKKLTSGTMPCDLSMAEPSVDIMAFQRGELLKQREDYIRALVRLIEGNSFRKYKIISDYASLSKQREILSLQIESEIEKNARKGVGVIAVNDSPAACVINPASADQVDGVKELLRRNQDLIAPKLTSDWQFVETTADLAFRGLQRQQCGYVAGEADVIRILMQALAREKMKYTFAPVWFESRDVEQATFDTRDAREQEIRKKAEKDRAQKEQDALEAKRRTDNENKKTEFERKLRQNNGVKARGLMNGIHDFVRGLADKRLNDVKHLFPDYSNWLDRRFADQWETFNVTSEVADFGTVQWSGRALDAIVVKSVIQQKNRILGKYEDRCYMFGLVDDHEFMMQRDPFAIDCDTGAGFLRKWKVGEKFQSQWNVD